jgi:hypothetical protein
MNNLGILNGIAQRASKAKEEKDMYVGSWIIDMYPEFKGPKEGLIVEGPLELEGLEIYETLDFGKVKLHILTPKASYLLAADRLSSDQIPPTFGTYRHIFGIDDKGLAEDVAEEKFSVPVEAVVQPPEEEEEDWQ